MHGQQPAWRKKKQQIINVAIIEENKAAAARLVASASWRKCLKHCNANQKKAAVA